MQHLVICELNFNVNMRARNNAIRDETEDETTVKNLERSTREVMRRMGDSWLVGHMF